MQTSTFAELGLSAKVQAAIQAAGYTTPTPIQSQAIPVAVTGRDVLGIAQTGTGKTAGFVLPMLARLESGRARARMPRSLILAPTRELAAQVAQSFEKYGVNHRLTVALVMGGVSFDDQLKKLDRGADVLIATPGRLLDPKIGSKLLLTGVEILVIDEADRMLDMGFIPDIEKICKLLPAQRQTLFFSATMPPEIQRLVDTFLKDPVRIEVAPPATAANTITQLFRYCPATEDWEKREALRDLIRAEQVKNAIIFCNRKRDVAILLKSLLKHGFNAGALHGDMDQMSRTATLDAFREGRITLLAASDVAARGLDIPDVSHIFNFDVPWQADDYVHRIGRTGRAGKEGRSLTIVTVEDIKQLKDIEKMLGAPVTWIGDPPTEEDIAEGSRKRRGRGGAKRAGDSRRSASGREGRRERGQDAGAPRSARGRSRRPERAPQPNGNGAHEPAANGVHPHNEERQPASPVRAERQPASPVRAERPPRQPASPAREPAAAKPQRQRRERKPPRQPWEPREPRPRDRDDRVPTPVGLGDHVPAFLRRPVRSGH
ncbi:MAG TPA: DEAD/DEAH box helicase [Hyphomicrobiaceae bacterium]|nr:DEAD/DEAH box helicase [Hyphomicrobiaceae bacterium]